MNKTLIVIISLILTVMDVWGNEPSQQYLDLVGQADKAAAECKWGDAQQYLLQAMRLEPSNPTNVLLLSNLGMMQFSQGQDSLALSTLTQAHNLAPASVTILSNRARVLAAMGLENRAYDDYSQIIKLDSTVVEQRMNHALLALKRGDIDTASADCDMLLKIAPDSLHTEIAMASLCTSTNRWNTAIPHYNRIIKKDPQAHFYGARALCHLMTDRLGEAADDLAQALALDPDDGELYLYRAVLNKLRYRPDDARKDALRAQQLGVDPRRTKQFL